MDVRWKVIKAWDFGLFTGRTLSSETLVLEKKVDGEWVEVSSTYEHHYVNKESGLYRLARKWGWI